MDHDISIRFFLLIVNKGFTLSVSMVIYNSLSVCSSPDIVRYRNFSIASEALDTYLGKTRDPLFFAKFGECLKTHLAANLRKVSMLGARERLLLAARVREPSAGLRQLMQKWLGKV